MWRGRREEMRAYRIRISIWWRCVYPISNYCCHEFVVEVVIFRDNAFEHDYFVGDGGSGGNGDDNDCMRVRVYLIFV